MAVDHIDQTTTYVDDGIELLLHQFKDATKLQGLLQSYLARVQDFENAFYPLIESRWIQNATGNRLDGLGAIVGQERQGRDDDDYRILIRARLIVNKSHGDLEQLIDLVRTLQDDASLTVPVSELYPAYIAFWVFGLPDDGAAYLYNQLMQAAKASGVRLHLIYSLQPKANTFSFSATAASGTSATQGFSDVTDSSAGGGFFAGVLGSASTGEDGVASNESTIPPSGASALFFGLTFS